MPAPGPPRFYRITELLLRDPRFVLGTTDITDDPFLGQSVNGSLIPGGLTMDYRGDGFADVSLLLGLSPADPTASAAELLFADADCVLAELDNCRAQASPTLHAMLTVENRQAGTCLSPIEGTADGFDDRGLAPEGPCFVSQGGHDVVIDLGSVRLELTDTVLSASYDGPDAGRLVRGLIQGFLPEARADAILLPDYLPLLANTPLSTYLRAADKDAAASPSGEDGWWVYLNFEAEPVSYQVAP